MWISISVLEIFQGNDDVRGRAGTAGLKVRKENGGS